MDWNQTGANWSLEVQSSFFQLWLSSGLDWTGLANIMSKPNWTGSSVGRKEHHIYMWTHHEEA